MKRAVPAEANRLGREELRSSTKALAEFRSG